MILADAWGGLPYVWLVPYLIAFCCAAGLFGAFCLFRIFSPTRKWWHFFALIFAAPFGLIAIKFFLGVNAQKEQQRWREYGWTLPSATLEYYRTFPERIHRIGSDEECTMDGFAEWFRDSYIAEHKRDWPEVQRMFSYRGNQILDPAGNPLCYAVDFNSDRVILFRGQKFDVMAPPSCKRCIAVLWRPTQKEFVPLFAYDE